MTCRIAFAAALFCLGFSTVGKAANCSPTSRTKQFVVSNYRLPAAGDIHEDIKDLKFTLIESRFSNCQITTKYALDFTEYNHWQSGNGYDPGHASIYVDLTASDQVIQQSAVTISAPMGFCGPYGTNGRHFHYEGGLRENYFDATDGINIRNSGIHGKVGRC